MSSTGKELRQCKSCVDKIKTWPSDDKKFCDKQCHGDWLSENNTGKDHWQYDEDYHIDTVCDYCGSEIEITQSDSECFDFHFCDRECQGGWQSEYRVDEKAANWKGGTDDDFGDNWDEMRDKVLKRDDESCQICGRSGGLIDVHHIVPRRDFEELENANTMDNLVTLCRSHHMKMEAKSENTQREILGVTE